MSGPGTVPSAILREGQVGPELAGTAGNFLAFGSDGRHVEGVPAPSGTLTPLSSWLVVDPANAGTHTGAFSGSAAFATMTAAAAALAADGGQLAVLTGDYSLEPALALPHATTIQGVGSPALPALHPAADLFLLEIFDVTTVAPTAAVEVTGSDANIEASGASATTYVLTGNSVLAQSGATGIANAILTGGQLLGPLTATGTITARGGTLLGGGGTITANEFNLEGISIGQNLTGGDAAIIGCTFSGTPTLTFSADLTIDRDSYETAIALGVTFVVAGAIHVLAPTNDYKVGPTDVASGAANAVIGSVALALIGKNISPGGGSLALLANVLCPTAGYTTGFWLMATLTNDGAGGWTANDTNFTPINPAPGMPNAQVTNLEFHINGANLEVRATTAGGAANPLAFIGHIQALGPS